VNNEPEQAVPPTSDAVIPKSDLVTPSTADEVPRNWLPLVIATAVVMLVGGTFLLTVGRGKKPEPVVSITAAPDAYAASLPISNIAMSEAGNLAGGKLTYIDGHIANRGNRIVTGATVQVLFRNGAHEVVQNESQTLKLIRMREPYVDIAPVSSAPIKPGDEKDFRLILDNVSADWDGTYPELRIIRVDAR